MLLRIREGACRPANIISVGCFLDGSADLHIGDRVHLAAGVQLWTSTHEIGESHLRAGKSVALSTTIGDGSWIGAGSIVLAGVHVGAGSIVAAGALVRQDVPENGLVAGVPARMIKDLTDKAS